MTTVWSRGISKKKFLEFLKGFWRMRALIVLCKKSDKEGPLEKFSEPAPKSQKQLAFSQKLAYHAPDLKFRPSVFWTLNCAFGPLDPENWNFPPGFPGPCDCDGGGD